MRKLLAGVLVVALTLSLAGCSSKSEEVKKVERLINAIGTVSFEREAYIDEAQAAYDELLLADKDTVGNYQKLKDAKETLIKLYEEKRLAEQKAREELEASTPYKEALIKSECADRASYIIYSNSSYGLQKQNGSIHYDGVETQLKYDESTGDFVCMAGISFHYSWPDLGVGKTDTSYYVFKGTLTSDNQFNFKGSINPTSVSREKALEALK